MVTRQQVLNFFVIITLLFTACSIFDTNTEQDKIVPYGLDGKVVNRLVFNYPYLYACATDKGLWRIDVQDDTDFQYLGLAYTGSLDYFRMGVQDVVVDPANLNSMLVAFMPWENEMHRMYKTVNSGKSWEPADGGLCAQFGDTCVPKTMTRLELQKDRLLGVGNGLLQSKDFGTTWERIRLPAIVEGPVFECHEIHEQYMWYGGYYPFFPSDPELYFSKDAGKSWTAIDFSSHKYLSFGTGVHSIKIDPVDANTVYVGLSEGIIKTVDNGEKWTPSFFADSSMYYFKAIEIDPRNRKHVWASANTKVLESYDAGETWKVIESDIDCTIFDLLWVQNTRSLYIGTKCGVFKL